MSGRTAAAWLWSDKSRLLGVLLLVFPAGLTAATASVMQSLQANIAAQGAFSATSYSFPLSKTGSLFNSFTGTLTLLYRVRTGSSAGSAGVTLKASADFTPAGGPSISTPPSAGDALTYVCAGQTLGTGCSGTRSVSTTAATPVLTFPPSVCTGAGAPCNNADPNSSTLTFTLTDDPKYRTGSYTTTLQFTISAF